MTNRAYSDYLQQLHGSSSNYFTFSYQTIVYVRHSPTSEIITNHSQTNSGGSSLTLEAYRRPDKVILSESFHPLTP